MMPRRSTATLTLVLIGAAALPGCGGSSSSGDNATRDVYRTRADCQRDWGDDAKKCEAQSSGRHSGYFYGPMYGTGYRSFSSSTDSATLAPRKGSNAISSTTVSRSSGSSSSGSVARGGFGSSASAHSSGG